MGMSVCSTGGHGGVLVLPDYHICPTAATLIRSPEHFHQLLLTNIDGDHEPSHWIVDISLAHISSFFSGYYVASLLRAGADKGSVVVESSEEMSVAVETFWSRLVGVPLLRSRLGLLTHPGIEAGKYSQRWRVNVGDLKGSGAQTMLSRPQQEGLYRISGYQRMLDASRQWIDKLWRDDCLRVSDMTQHQYSACFNS